MRAGCRPWTRRKTEAYATLLLKFKNDFAAAFALRGVFNRDFDIAKGVSFFNFLCQQTAPGHVAKWSKRFHALRRAGVVIPFVNPDAAKAQVFENEKPCRNFQRLQAHRAKAYQRAARCKTVSQAQRAISTHGIQTEPNRCAAGRAR